MSRPLNLHPYEASLGAAANGMTLVLRHSSSDHVIASFSRQRKAAGYLE